MPTQTLVSAIRTNVTFTFTGQGEPFVQSQSVRNAPDQADRILVLLALLLLGLPLLCERNDGARRPGALL